MAYVNAMLALDPAQFPNLRILADQYATVHDVEALYDVGLRSLVSGFETLARDHPADS